jgi:hypothetical protein
MMAVPSLNAKTGRLRRVDGAVPAVRDGQLNRDQSRAGALQPGSDGRCHLRGSERPLELVRCYKNTTHACLSDLG